jgi:hypothetical protein
VRPVVPSGELPDSVSAVMFQPPPGTEEEVTALPGIVHLGPDGQPIACEFMFEFTKDEIKVLKHEPFVTITMMVQAPPVFAIQTTFDPDPKFDSLNEHQHICTENLTHENRQFWRCDNPTHNAKDQRIRTCDPCYRYLEEDAISGEEEQG